MTDIIAEDVEVRPGGTTVVEIWATDVRSVKTTISRDAPLSIGFDEASIDPPPITTRLSNPPIWQWAGEQTDVEIRLPIHADESAAVSEHTLSVLAGGGDDAAVAERVMITVA